MYHDKKRYDHKTKYTVSKENWDGKKVVKGEGANLINNALKNLCVEIENRWLKNPSGSVKDFLSDTPAVALVQKTDTLIQGFEYYVKSKRNEVTHSTVQKINVIKQLVTRFQGETKEWLIKDVDTAFKMKFEEYCEEKGYSHNTIARAIKHIKTICTHARASGILTSPQLDNITVKYKKVDKVFLSLAEIKKIEGVKLSEEHLVVARDWLLISCETGQRVSDFMRFRKDKVRVSKSKHLIDFTQAKTSKLMSIPLSKKVLSVLKKRKGEFPPQQIDQQYNENIKEVCRLSGITAVVKGSKIDPETNRKVKGNFEKWELVSSHVGRRSFATNNYGRVPTSILMYMTGHATERTFLEYVGKTETEKAMQAAEYF